MQQKFSIGDSDLNCLDNTVVKVKDTINTIGCNDNDQGKMKNAALSSGRKHKSRKTDIVSSRATAAGTGHRQRCTKSMVALHN